MSRRILKMAVFLAVSCAAPMTQRIAAAQPAEQAVTDHLAFFEHLFAVVGMTTGVNQDAYFHQLRISDDQAQIVRGVVAQFRSQEDFLKQQANAILAADQPDANALAQVRSQRQRLLIVSSCRLLRQLGPEGAAKLVDYAKKVAAVTPRR